MDINQAALELKKIEIIEKQIEHLQKEAARDRGSYEIYEDRYDIDCNSKAQELIKLLNLAVIKQE